MSNTELYAELNCFENIPKNGELMTMNVFENKCIVCELTDYDGYGYYSLEDKMTRVNVVFPSYVLKNKHDKRYTHVVWFNRK